MNQKEMINAFCDKHGVEYHQSTDDPELYEYPKVTIKYHDGRIVIIKGEGFEMWQWSILWRTVCIARGLGRVSISIEDIGKVIIADNIPEPYTVLDIEYWHE